MTDLKSRLSKISSSPKAKTVRKQTTTVLPPSKLKASKKPGPKNTWKDNRANYVRLYTQLQETDRNTLKSSVAGGVLYEDFESVDHFINEAVIRLMTAYGLETVQGSIIN